jgi:N-acetylmuramoyl-L-alanine amidase CwlA
MSIDIVKCSAFANTTGLTNRNIAYIVIHYTAGSTSRPGAAKNNAVMFANPSIGASADFIVDDETIVQYNPDINNRYCWHCGDNKNPYSMGGSYYGKCTNANSIGIEICCTNPNWKDTEPANTRAWSFTSAVINKAVELTRYLMEQYGIPAERVIRHYDVSGKLCPGIIGWNEDSKDVSQWKAFKAKLTNSTNTKTDDVIYRVRKSANDAKSQIGAYRNLNSAKALADKNSGYSVYDTNGKLIYTPTKQTAKKPVTEIAKEVIQGKWGNGEERKQKLTKAGYDYDKVQAEVNRLMSV